MRRALPILSLTLAVGTAFAAHAATIEYIAHARFVIESDAGERVLEGAVPGLSLNLTIPTQASVFP